MFFFFYVYRQILAKWFNPVLPDSQLCSQTCIWLSRKNDVAESYNALLYSYCACSGHSGQLQHSDQAASDHFVLFAWGAVVSNRNACCKRKTDLVFKTDKYLLNNRNSPTVYAMPTCVHVPVSGRCFMKCLLSSVCVCYNKYSSCP